MYLKMLLSFTLCTAAVSFLAEEEEKKGTSLLQINFLLVNIIAKSRKLRTSLSKILEKKKL